jgi:hypothetical protein
VLSEQVLDLRGLPDESSGRLAFQQLGRVARALGPDSKRVELVIGLGAPTPDARRTRQ